MELKGKIMRKIWKLFPLILTPLLLSSCNIVSPKAESVSEDVHSDDTEEIDGVKVTLSGDSKVVSGNKVKLTLSMDPSDQMPSKKITWKSSDNTILKKVTTGTTKTACEFNALALGTATVSVSSYFANDTSRPFTKTFEVEVVRPELTGITISTSRNNMGLNSTMAFSVSPTPSGAELPEINWSVDNTNLASISNTGVLTSYSTEGSVVVTAKTVDNKFEASKTISIQEIVLDKWTLMIYLCGNDLESGYANQTTVYDDYGNAYSWDGVGLAVSDIQEILSVNGQPDDVNILIQTGGASVWTNNSKYGHYSDNYTISNERTQRHRVVNNKIVLEDDTLGDQSMGLTSTFQSFLEWGLTDYPAEKTGVILWNHGGAMQGVCYDENHGDDSLLTDEVYNAVNGAFEKTGRSKSDKLEFIGYDACLMAVQDIAIKNSEFFNYMVCSQESEAGEGYDYETWIDDLYADKPTTTILKAICDGFIKDNGGVSSSGNQTQSYLDLSYAEEYKNAWNNMAKHISITSSTKSSFKSLIKSCQHYAGSSYTGYGTFDAKDFVNELADSSFDPGSTYTDAVLTAHSHLVAYETHQQGAGNSNGICLFWSVSSYCNKNSYYKSSMTDLTDWRSLVITYGD